MPEATTTHGAAARPEVDPARFGWREHTASPRPPDDATGDEALGALCGRRDGALDAASHSLSHDEGEATRDVAKVAFELRRQGAPYVWPRAWTLAGPGAIASAPERIQPWLSGLTSAGERRCGAATARGDRGEVVVALAVEVIADLAPLPTVVRSGTWLDVDAELLVPASAVKVVVLGPTGRPYAVPTSYDRGRVRARFRADRAGVWLMQVLATVAGGPRPVVEALVHADVEPAREYDEAPAPGEELATSAGDDAAALQAMLNGARASEGVRALTRDPRLAALAEEHAAAMRAARHIAHDLGAGNPASRVQAAGISVRASGENVAHAADVVRAHRALWASPSHRENLLIERFSAVGVGVARDEDGTVWVCVIFADLAGNRMQPD